MIPNAKRYLTLAAALGLCLSVAGQSATARADGDLSAFAGRWKINLEKSRMGRQGPNRRGNQRDPNFTWMFTPEGKDLRMDVYTAYPQPEPTRTMTVHTDGRYHPCRSKGSCLTGPGDPNVQSYAYWQTDPRMLVRIFKVNGKIVEYSTYAVSTDGKTFSALSWSPGTPEYTNDQVFDRQ